MPRTAQSLLAVFGALELSSIQSAGAQTSEMPVIIDL